MNKKSRNIKYHHLIDIMLLVLIVALYISTNYPNVTATMGRIIGGPVYKGIKGNNRVSLQFEVSWNAESIEEILKILKEQNINVTFIVTGNWAKNNQNLLKRIVLDGHEIATMGMGAQEKMNYSWLKNDLIESIKEIKNICGADVAFYYSDEENLSIKNAVADELGIKYVICTVDLKCAEGNAEDIKNRALFGASDGNIILLQPTSSAKDALDGIINNIKKKGMSIVPTGKIIG